MVLERKMINAYFRREHATSPCRYSHVEIIHLFVVVIKIQIGQFSGHALLSP